MCLGVHEEKRITTTYYNANKYFTMIDFKVWNKGGILEFTVVAQTIHNLTLMLSQMKLQIDIPF